MSTVQWADLVRDVATGMTAVPLTMHCAVSVTAISLLEKLSQVVRVSYCKLCCLPTDEYHCTHLLTPPTVPPTAGTPVQAAQAVYTTALTSGSQTQLTTASTS